MKHGSELVGREVEIGRLDEALSALGPGASVVAISGEPGIGKTSLLGELCSRADDAGHLVLNGRCAEFESDLPFAPLVDALDDYLASLNPSLLTPLGDDALAELAHLFPALAPLDLPDPSGPQDERYRSHHAVRTLLELLATRKPVILALDDLHWADEATLELLAHLLRRPPRRPALLALAFRSAQAARLAPMLGELERDAAAIRIELPPLAPEQAKLLLGERIPEEMRDALYRESGGNPFYLDELARGGASAEPGLGSAVEATEEGVPAAVGSALARELDGLTADLRTLAQGAAVAGESFELELAAAGARIDAPEALPLLDELLAGDLIRRTDVPRRFRFRHPIVRRAIYESAAPAWRLGAHARLAAQLERNGAPALVRARHVECSASPGDEQAIAVLTEAGADALLRAPASAAHWQAAALRLLPADDAGRRLGLVISRAQALGYAGRLRESKEMLDQALRLLPDDEFSVRGQLVAGRARIDQILGEHGDAKRSLLSTLEAMPDGSGPAATALKVQLATACFFSGDFDGLRRWVAEALTEAESRDDRASLAAATGTLGCAEYMVGNMPPARARLDRAAELFGGLSDDTLARLHSLIWCGMCEVYLERFDRATALLDRGFEVARATGHGHVTTLARIGRALIDIHGGRLDAGAENADLAIEAARLTGNEQFLTWGMWTRSWAATLSGDLKLAVEIGQESYGRAGDDIDPVSAMAGCCLAEARLEAGDPVACRETILEAAGGPELGLFERAFKSHLYELLTRAELALGEPDRAADWACRAEEAAEGLEIHGRSAEALRARAAVELARGGRGAAAEAALAAADSAARAGLPIDEGRGRLIAGLALAADDRDRAQVELASARDAFSATGAARYRDRAAAALRELGARVAHAPRRRVAEDGGVPALSEREREVAGLVTEGHTNKEIAAELFLSEKTIESHMSRIFGKLGVSKRAQVAAAIGREREPARD